MHRDKPDTASDDRNMMSDERKTHQPIDMGITASADDAPSQNTLDELRNEEPAVVPNQMDLGLQPSVNESTIFRAKVLSASRKSDVKVLNIEDDRGVKSQKKVHPFALVGKGDAIAISGSSPNQLYLIGEGQSNFIRLSPHFFRRTTKSIGDIGYDVTITEITNQDDLDSYEYLERFHYRTSSESLSDDPDHETKDVGGRKAILLLYTDYNGIKQAAGYIELQMPLLMMKPRHELFSAPFEHPSKPVSWSKWGAKEMAAHVNRIARIARLVVSPEYRGLGLAKLLIQTATEYCQERWHQGGRRPLFLEISAEMLNHIDFVTSSGFHYVGSTQGNLKRIVKDMKSMAKGRKSTFGVMSLQNKYFSKFSDAAQRAGMDFDSFLDRLELLLADGNANTFNAADWYYYRAILRFPQRYYLLGLDDYARRYLLANCKAAPSTRSTTPRTSTSRRLAVSQLSVRSNYTLPDSESVRVITDCFGITSKELSTTILRQTDIEIGPGHVILIAGASGSGKSVLLRALDPEFQDHHLTRTFNGTASLPSAGWLRAVDSTEPVIEYFSKKYGTEATISTFHKVGLSEAFVFVKPFNLLSRGQRYRVMLADLILREQPVWLIDEFCADLDPISAAIVAHNLRRMVLRQGRIAFVAAANHSHFLAALRPTMVYYLRNSGAVEIYKYRTYHQLISRGAK